MTKPELAKPVATSNGASASRTAASPETASSHRHALKSAQQGPTIWSPRKASLIGGVALLLLAVLAGLANFGVVEALVTPGDGANCAEPRRVRKLVSIGHCRSDDRRHSRYRRSLRPDGTLPAG